MPDLVGEMISFLMALIFVYLFCLLYSVVMSFILKVKTTAKEHFTLFFLWDN